NDYVSGGSDDYEFSAEKLPAGIKISPDGVISGTPAKPGNGGEVTITVTAAAENVGRLEYYLDGIKIYNPMDTTPDETTGEVDETVAGAYGDEMNAYFASVRDFLIEAGTFDGSTLTNGAVFIDRVIVGDTDGDSTDNYENAMAVYESYGPKNEVYLAAGQSIAFNAGSNETIVQVALKAPEASQGESGYAVANVSDVDADGNAIQGEVTVDHSTDLFYQVTPDANGYVIIQNEGPGILSVTKVKFIVSDADTETGIAEASIDELLLASEEFDVLPVAAYSLRASAPETEDSTDPETPVEPEQPTEPEEPTEPSGPNVEIENPEEPAEPEQPDVEAIQEQIKQFVTSLFNAFRGWFGR
ncbi:MAG: putative Ig domain-containing protein, partial [Oscillospiraceae bacterium]|nr:putative Ig domain-containing protein [Oscillospiraceae bacterium]